MIWWLQSQYVQKWRVYHTLGHVKRMFEMWDETRRTVAIRDPQSLSLAIWLHDAVYDPTRQDNEERSAEEAVARLEPLGIIADTIARVQQMILATATHEVDAEDKDTALLLDLDLAILGASEDEYDSYARAIRQEYAHVTDADYRRERAQVLRGFLGRPRIFRTAPMAARFERQAHENIAKEIAALESTNPAEMDTGAVDAQREPHI